MTPQERQVWFETTEKALRDAIHQENERASLLLSPSSSPLWLQPLSAYESYHDAGGVERLLTYFEDEDPVWWAAALLALGNLGHAAFKPAWDAWQQLSDPRGEADLQRDRNLGCVIAMSWELADAMKVCEELKPDRFFAQLYHWLYGLEPGAGPWDAIATTTKTWGHEGTEFLVSLIPRTQVDAQFDSGLAT
ncbi:MAG: hypothetical protein AAF544_06280, partial [Bacteroidota bacterium]